MLTVLCSGRETKLTWTYGKKAVESANKGTEAAEEPAGSLTVSMPLGEFKWAITQRGLFVNEFSKTFILTC